jgi:hypothetical protein
VGHDVERNLISFSLHLFDGIFGIYPLDPRLHLFGDAYVGKQKKVTAGRRSPDEHAPHFLIVYLWDVHSFAQRGLDLQNLQPIVSVLAGGRKWIYS